MSFLRRCVIFLNDWDRLGLGFARAAFRPWRHKAPFFISLANHEPIWVRGDDSDIDTVRIVFANKDYHVPSASARERLATRMQEIADSGRVPLIIDAGANIGAAALWFKHQYPLALVVAVEPEQGNIAMLKRNCGKDGFDIVPAAIGSKSGFVALENAGSSDAVRTVRDEHGVPIMTMRDLLDKHPNATPFIVKVDIEGFEGDLFSSDTEWIDSFDAIMVELHDWMLPGQGSSAGVQREMGKRTGYEVFLKGENLIYVRG